MMESDRGGRPASRWFLWLEICLLLAVVAGLGIAHFSRLTPAQKQGIQLEAGLQQLYELEADHKRREGTYFDPRAPEYRAYLPWMDRYDVEARWVPQKGFAVVVRVDFDGDGELGTWRIDQTSPQAQLVVAD